MVSRAIVYSLIDGEREYQDRLNPKQVYPGCDIALLHQYLGKATDVFANTFGDPNEQPTMDVLRKIAAICVRAMEQNGCPARDIENSLAMRDKS